MKGKKLLTLVGLCLVAVLVLPFMAACTEPEEQEYIILGAPLALGYPDGVCARDNLELAIDEINDAGGFDVGGTKYKFDFVTLDTRDLEPGVPVSEALLAVEKLILDKDADFIVGGPIRSEAALAAMELASQYETVFLWSAGFLSPCFACRFAGCPPPPMPPCPEFAGDYDKYKYCFRTQDGAGPLGSECVELLDKIATDEGLAKEVCVMVQDVAHAVGAIMGTVKPGLEALGWTVHSVEKFPTGTTDFSTSLLAAQDTGAPFLIPWFDMPESSICLKQWYDLQVPMLPVGLVVPGHDSLAWTSFAGKCEYLVNCYPKAGITGINSEARHYIDLYESEINPAGPAETWVGPVCYQSIYILKDALERAGSLDPDDVIPALEATDMVGVYGKIAFDDNHDMICSQDPATGAITTWVQWIDGERLNVYPDAIATDDVVLPPWM